MPHRHHRASLAERFRQCWEEHVSRRRTIGPLLPRAPLHLEPLEERTLLAFSATIDSAGLLSILSDESTNIIVSLTTDPTPSVKVNGLDPTRAGGGPTPSTSVRRVQIVDGSFGNLINLAAITVEAFPNIDGPVTINAGSGNDSIIGSEWTDSIVAGQGNDWIEIEKGRDSVWAGDGNDSVRVGNDNLFIDLGTGNDLVSTIKPDGGEGSSVLDGGDGNDTIDGGEGASDLIYGGNGDDQLVVRGSAMSLVLGQAGQDTIQSLGGGRSILVGGAGADSITSNAGGDILVDATLPYENGPFSSLQTLWDEWRGTLLPTPPGTNRDTPPVDVSVRRLLGILTTGDNFDQQVFLRPELIMEDNAVDTLVAGFGNDWIVRGTPYANISGIEYGVWVGTERSSIQPTDDWFVVPTSTSTLSIPAFDLLFNDTDSSPASLQIVSAELLNSSTPPGTSIEFQFDPSNSSRIDRVAMDWGSETFVFTFKYRLSFMPINSTLPNVIVSRQDTATQVVTGDFDGDGLQDALRIDPDSLDIATQTNPLFRPWTSLDTSVSWLDPVVGDFNGDGIDDLLMRHGLERVWYLWSTEGSGAPTRIWWGPWTRGYNWSQPVVGDFDRDGKDDLFSFRPGNADLVIARSTGLGFQETVWNNIREQIHRAYGSIPQNIIFDAGQFDGVRGDDILAHDSQGNGDWAFVLADGFRFTNLSVPVSFPDWSSNYYVGNFDPDPSDEIIIWRNAGPNNNPPARWESAEVQGATIALRPPLGSSHPNRNDFVVRDLDWDGDEDFVARTAAETSPFWRVLRTSAGQLAPIDSATWDAWLDASTFLAGGKRIFNEINPIQNLRLESTLPGIPQPTVYRPVVLGDLPIGFQLSERISIEFDTDSDGRPDGWARVDPTTRSFRFLPFALASGPVAIRARISVSRPDQTIGFSPWTNPLNFHLIPEPNDLPIPTLVELADDIGGREGDTLPLDRKVRSATLRYRVTPPDTIPLSSLQVEFDHDGDGIVDGRAPATAGLSNYTPVGLAGGTHALRARTRRISDGFASDWSTPFPFSLSVAIDATLRDFPNPDLSPLPPGLLRHPHFEGNIDGTGPRLGVYRQMVQPTLGPDDKPVYSPLAVKAPSTQLVPNPLAYEPFPVGNQWRLLGTSNSSFPLSPEQYFQFWYNSHPLYNTQIDTSLWFEESSLGSGEFEFKSTSFFPLDQLGFGKQGQDHNFSFTLELKGEFTYRQGQSLRSSGSDDDLWMFVNRQLVVDIGGIHSAETAASSIDSLGLVDGQSYPFHVFFAERHTSQSNLQIALRLADLRNDPPGDPILIEQNRFFTDSASRGQTIPIRWNQANAPAALSFDIDSLLFDTTDPASINDAFEITLTNAQGQSVIPTIGLGRQAFFNKTEGEPFTLAPGVAYVAGPGPNQGRVYVDLRAVPASTPLFLSAHLVNNDGLSPSGQDETTQARLLGSSVQYYTTLPAGLGWQTNGSSRPLTRPSTSRPPLDQLTSVWSSFTSDYGLTSFNSQDDSLFVDIDLAHQGPASVRGDYPILLVVRDISDPTIGLLNPHGITAEGDPYYDVTSLLSKSSTDDWTTGDSATLSLPFSNPERRRFTYRLDALGRYNASPVWTDFPTIVEWRPTPLGNDFALPLVASDPEQDAIRYDIVAGPAGLAIDSASGEVRWSGTPALGDYLVRLQATDTRGARSAPASFTVRVLDAANRPPRFTSTPEGIVRAGRLFTHEPSAIDPDGDPVQITSQLLPPRATYDAATRQLRWTPQVDEIGASFPLELLASDGRGGQESQRTMLRVVADPANQSPLIVSTPSPQHFMASGSGTSATGNVSPTSISLNLAAGQISSPQTVSVTLATGLTNTVDIVFLIDRSPSMRDKQEWLIGNDSPSVKGMIEQIEEKLSALNIRGNRFGFVLYGIGTEAVQRDNSRWLADGNDANMIIDTPEVRAFLSLPSSMGIPSDPTQNTPNAPENAFAAIQTALSQYTFRPGAGVNFILLTDEDADDYSIANQQTLLQELVDRNVTFTAITRTELNANDAAGNIAGFNPQSGTWSVRDRHWEGVAPPNSEALNLATWDPTLAVNVGNEAGSTSVIFAPVSFEVDFSLPETSPSGRFRFYFGYQSSFSLSYYFIETDFSTATWRAGYRFLGLPEVIQTLDSATLPTLIKGERYTIRVSPVGENGDAYVALNGNYLPALFSRLFPGSQPPSLLQRGRYGFSVVGGQAEVYGVRSRVTPFGNANISDTMLAIWRQEFGWMGSRPVDGLAADGTAYLSTSTGVTNLAKGGRPIPDDSLPTEETRLFSVSHFWPLVQVTGGSLWNLNAISGPLRSPLVGQFSTTFAETQSRVLMESSRPELVPSDPSAIRSIRPLPPTTSTSNTASYEVEFVGDGRSRELNLQFVSRFLFQGGGRIPDIGQGIVGQIPVRIQGQYVYQLRAIDPENDTPLLFRWTNPQANLFGATLTSNGLFRWDPASQNIGVGQTRTFSVTVEDPFGGRDTQQWTVNVVSPLNNAPPSFILPTPTSAGTATIPDAREGTLYEYLFRAIDPDLEAVQYFFLGSPPTGATLDPDTGRFRWRPMLTGPTGFAILAMDSRGRQARLSVSLNVVDRQAGNASPVITSGANPFPMAVVGTLYQETFAATDPNNDAVQFLLSAGPNGMMVDADTGRLVWRPERNQVGSHHILVVAQDARGQATPIGFTIDVYDINRPPTIEARPRLAAEPGKELRVPLTVNDPDGDRLLFEFDPADVADWPLAHRPIVDPQQHFLWNVPPNQPAGTYAFDLYVRDRRGGIAQQTLLLEVAPGTTTPSLQPRVTLHAPANQAGSYAVLPSAPGRSITIDDFALGVGFQVDGMSIRWLPNPAAEIAPITITLLQDGQALARQEFSLVLHPPVPAGTPPTVDYEPLGPLAADIPFHARPTVIFPSEAPVHFEFASPPPAGLTIEPTTGALSWIPSRYQAGPHTLQLRATAGSLERMIHLPLIVLDNAPPTFATIAQPNFSVDAGLWSLPLQATDPNPGDADGVTYSLISGPPGMSIVNQQLVFDPNTPGLYPFVVQTRDARGASSLLRQTLRVVSGGNNQPPIIAARNDVRLRAGLPFRTTIDATDPDGDAITFRKISGPATLFVSPTGTVEWNTTPSDISGNTHSFRVEAVDARGAATQRTFGLNVFLTGPSNRPPEIVGQPKPAVLLGDTFSFTPIAQDPDFDLLTWSLPLAPAGVDFDPLSGQIRWEPRSALDGPGRFVLRVEDGFGGSFERPFTVRVATTNLPPVRQNDSPVVAYVNEPVQFPLFFEDPEGDTLTYTLTGPNPWLSANSNNQTLAGIAPGIPGNSDFVLTVSDGPNQVTHSFRINVRNNTRPSPPLLGNPNPTSFGVLQQLYTYDPKATDPNSDPLSYQVLGLPGATIQNGVVLWLVPPSTPTTIPTQGILIVTDTTGAKTILPLSIQILASNAPPVISTDLNTFIRIRGERWSVNLRPLVSDPDPGDLPTLRIESVAASPPIPNAPTLQPTGTLEWSGEGALLGLATFRLIATDRTGASTSREFTIETRPDLEPPRTEVLPRDTTVPARERASFVIFSSDNVALGQLQALVIRINPPGPAQLYDLQGSSRTPLELSFDSTGVYQVVPIARDREGNESRGLPAFVRVIDPSAPPTRIELAAPIDTAPIREPVAIVGTIDFPSGAEDRQYRARFYDLANPTTPLWSTTGSADLLQQSLGYTIDPRTLADGLYAIEIEADYRGSSPVRLQRTIVVESAQKIGNFAVAYTDMSLPVAGIPIIVQRAYDSFRIGRDNDFGKGWRLAIANTDIDVDRTTTASSVGDSRLPAFKQGTRVTVTLPGGQRETFSFEPFAPPGPIQLRFTPRFRAINGATSTLSIANPSFLYPGARDGEYLIDSPTGPRSFNPADPNLGDVGAYLLRTATGMTYTIDARTGDLLTQRDRVGNEIRFTGRGIVSAATGLGVEWTYDEQGRIDSLTGPGGRSVHYRYSPQGNLIEVVTDAGRSSQFEYASSRPHLLSAIREQGRLVMQPLFDPETGWLDKIVDADGKQANVDYSFNIGNNRTVERIVDSNSPSNATSFTEVVKDAQGRVIRQIRHIRELVNNAPQTVGYEVTVLQYDDADNLIATSRPFQLPANTPNIYDDGNPIFPVRTTYNLAGMPTLIVDALGNQTRLEYDQNNLLRRTIDPLGRVSVDIRDPNTGLLLESRDPEGRTKQYSYNAAGQLISSRTVRTVGNTTLFETLAETSYNAAGLPIRSQAAGGVERFFRYDHRQQMILAYRLARDESQSTGHAGSIIAERSIYNNSGEPIQSRYYVVPISDIQSTSLIEETLSNILSDAPTAAIPKWTTNTSYDLAGRLFQSQDRFGTITQTTYDARGLSVQTATQTRPTSDNPSNDNIAWLVTRTLYDDQGREILTTDPFLLSNPFDPSPDTVAQRTIYDSLERITRTERRSGVQINLVKSDPADTSPSAAYRSNLASLGTLITHQGKEAAEETFYDDARRVDYSVDRTTGLYTKNVYDAIDRVVKTIRHTSTNWSDPAALTSESIYDSASQLVRTIDPAGRSTWYEYDKSGRSTATTNEAILDPRTEQRLYVRSETLYDALGRRRATRQNLGQLAGGDPTSLLTTSPIDNQPIRPMTTEYAYDSAGRLESVLLPFTVNGAIGTPIYRYTYNQLGNQVTQTAPGESTTRFHYDVEGRTIGRTLPLGEQTTNNPLDFHESVIYDTLSTNSTGDSVYGQKTQEIDFEGRRTTYRYDNRPGAAGRLKQVEYFLPGNNTNNADERITYRHDSFGRTTQAQRFLRQAGTLVLVRTETTTYDIDGRITSIIHTGSQVDETDALFYEYDPFGRHIRTYTGQLNNPTHDIRYSHDPFGRLETVRVVERFDQVLSTPEETRYGYDRLGNLDWTELPGDLVVDHVYDQIDRLIDEVYFVDQDNDHRLDWNDANANGIYDSNEGERPLAQFTTTRDLLGRRSASIDRAFGLNNTITEQFRWTYDELGRLDSEHYVRNAFGTEAGYADYHQYDLRSNRLRVDRTTFGSFDDAAPHVTSIRRMNYDANDRLRSESFEHSAVTSRNFTQTFSYGANNATTQLTRQEKQLGSIIDQISYSYDPAGRQASLTTSSYFANSNPVAFTSTGAPQTNSFLYTIAGDRVRQTAGPNNINRYLVDPLSPTGYAEVLLETRSTAGNTQGILYTLGRSILSQASSLAPNQPMLFITDPLGSLRNVLSPSATHTGLSPHETYDAFGNRIGDGDLTGYSVSYAGQIQDPGRNLQQPTTGQIYSRARYYQPGTGTFTTLDPYLGNPQNPLSLHKYLYVHADPINAYDPTGMMSLGATMATTAISQGLQSVLLSAPFAVMDAANSLANNVSVTDVLLEQSTRLAGDFLTGAVFGASSNLIIRQLANNTWKAALLGQSYLSRPFYRLPWSPWRLPPIPRGLNIEKTILGRSATILGKKIANFPVIDDYIVSAGKGTVTSIKTIDLASPTYQGQALFSKLNGYANQLSNFNLPINRLQKTLPLKEYPIDERILLVAFEQGTASRIQTSILREFDEFVKVSYPNLKLVYQFIP